MSEPCPECGDYRFICDSAMGQGIARLTGRKIGKHGCWMNECADNRRACPTCSPSKRECFRCGKPAQNPSLPLCMSCDLDRLERGEAAADILKVVAKAKEKT
jgi:hypothetical protein